MSTIHITPPLKEALKKIKDYCRTNERSIATAESVTAGCIQLLLSTAPEAQQFFQGGITVYNCAQKAIHLNIDPIFAERCNAVDQSVADRMAIEVCRLFRSEIGVSVTGYATRVPEEGIDNLFAYTTIAVDGVIVFRKKINCDKEGIEAQEYYATKVIQLISEVLNEKENIQS